MCGGRNPYCAQVLHHFYQATTIEELSGTAESCFTALTDLVEKGQLPDSAIEEFSKHFDAAADKIIKRNEELAAAAQTDRKTIAGAAKKHRRAQTLHIKRHLTRLFKEMWGRAHRSSAEHLLITTKRRVAQLRPGCSFCRSVLCDSHDRTCRTWKTRRPSRAR